MNFNNIIEFLRVNGVKCDTRLRKIYEQDGCAVEALKPMFDDIVKTIERIVVSGTNDSNGFGGSEKNNILELVELLSEISREDSPAKQVEFDKRLKKIKSRVKEVELVMKDNIIARVKSYKAALNVIRRMPVGEDRLPLIDLFDAKLDELVKNLDEVVDFSSPEALKKAEAITKKLNEWSNITSRIMHDQTTTQILVDAIEISREWQTMQKPKKLFGIFNRRADNTATVDFKEEEESNSNLMVQIAMSAPKLMQIFNFGENLEAQQRIASNNHNERMSRLTGEKVKNENAIAAIEREKQNIVAQFQNGVIDQNMYYFKMKDLKNRFDRAKAHLDLAAVKLVKEEKVFASGQRVFEKLTELLTEIKQYESEPEKITIIAKYIDFEKLYNIMHGMADENDAEAINRISFIEKQLETIRNQSFTSIGVALDEQELAEYNEVMDEVRNEQASILSEVGNNMNEADLAELDAFAGVSFGNTNTQNTNPQNNTQTNVNNPQMMDDIMF